MVAVRPQPPASHPAPDRRALPRPRTRSRRHPRRRRTAGAGTFLALVALSAALTGCAGAQSDQVTAAAATFYAALADRDGATACDLLAPRTRSEVQQSAGLPCDRAVLQQDIPDVVGGVDRAGADPRKVSTFGTAAQVMWAGETTFLSRYDDGWRVVAAGCTPAAGGTYDCQVEAG